MSSQYGGTVYCCPWGYVIFMEECVDAYIIIGVAAGVGGAVLLILVVALVIVSCCLCRVCTRMKNFQNETEMRRVAIHVAQICPINDEQPTVGNQYETMPAAAASACNNVYNDDFDMVHDEAKEFYSRPMQVSCGVPVET
jgi:hypothetical protein